MTVLDIVPVTRRNNNKPFRPGVTLRNSLLYHHAAEKGKLGYVYYATAFPSSQHLAPYSKAPTGRSLWSFRSSRTGRGKVRVL